MIKCVRQFLQMAWRRAALSLCVVTLTLVSQAQTQQPTAPASQIKMISGFAAGGSADIIARLVAQYIQEKLGWSVIVENKPGAGGRTAAQEVARSKPDRSVIFVSNIVNAVLIPLTFSDAGYHPLKDFTPLARAADFQIAMVTGPMSGRALAR